MNLHEDLQREAHPLVYGNRAVNVRRSSLLLAPTRPHFNPQSMVVNQLIKYPMEMYPII